MLISERCRSIVDRKNVGILQCDREADHSPQLVHVHKMEDGKVYSWTNNEPTNYNGKHMAPVKLTRGKRYF